VRRLTADQRETFLANLTHMAGNSPSPAAREILGGVLTSAVDSEGDFSEEFQSILSNVQKGHRALVGDQPGGQALLQLDLPAHRPGRGHRHPVPVRG